MNTITLSMNDEALASLRKDFEALVRISRELDPRFSGDDFEDYLCVRLAESPLSITEQDILLMLEDGQYAWAKKTAQKNGSEVVKTFMEQAARFGFGFAARSEWTREQRLANCRKWADAIVREAGGAPAVADSLAAQISSSVPDVQTLEATMRTPAWTLLESIRPLVNRARDACLSTGGAPGRVRLGELRGLLRLAVAHGVIDVAEAQQTVSEVRRLKPQLFVDESNDIIARFANWLRDFLVPGRV